MSAIVIHLGDRKAGSTAIQYALAAGAVRAPGLRIGYSAPINHVPLARAMADPAEARHRAARLARALAPARAGSADVTVISAEDFEVVDPRVLRDALAAHAPDLAGRVRLIAYVRPHAERLLSSWAERVKQGHFLGTPDEMFDRVQKRSLLRYTPRFLLWRETFGAAFTLRPMIRDRLKGRDVVADFVDFALEGAPFDLADPPAANESLTLADLALLRALHLRLRPGLRPGKTSHAQKALGWVFARLLAGAPRPSGGTRPALHAALARRVQAACAADAAALDAAFFADLGRPMTEALAQAGARAVAEPQSIRAEDHYGPAELRLLDAWTWVVAEMLKADPEGWPAFFVGRQRAFLRARRAGRDGAGAD
jgi:hypothetical protein